MKNLGILFFMLFSTSFAYAGNYSLVEANSVITGPNCNLVVSDEEFKAIKISTGFGGRVKKEVNADKTLEAYEILKAKGYDVVVGDPAEIGNLVIGWEVGALKEGRKMYISNEYFLSESQASEGVFPFFPRLSSGNGYRMEESKWEDGTLALKAKMEVIQQFPTCITKVAE